MFLSSATRFLQMDFTLQFKDSSRLRVPMNGLKILPAKHNNCWLNTVPSRKSKWRVVRMIQLFSCMKIHGKLRPMVTLMVAKLLSFNTTVFGAWWPMSPRKLLNTLKLLRPWMRVPLLGRFFNLMSLASALNNLTCPSITNTVTLMVSITVWEDTITIARWTSSMLPMALAILNHLRSNMLTITSKIMVDTKWKEAHGSDSILAVANITCMSCQKMLLTRMEICNMKPSLSSRQWFGNLSSSCLSIILTNTKIEATSHHQVCTRWKMENWWSAMDQEIRELQDVPRSGMSHNARTKVQPSCSTRSKLTNPFLKSGMNLFRIFKMWRKASSRWQKLSLNLSLLFSKNSLEDERRWAINIKHELKLVFQNYEFWEHVLVEKNRT